MSRHLFLFVLSVVLMCHAKLQLPSFIKQCSLTDGKTKDCLLENMELLRPHFKESIPQFKLLPICPAYFPKVEVIISNINLTSINASVFNACSYKVSDFDMDMENSYMKLNMFFPNLTLIAHYYINGRLLVLNLEGDGKAKLTLQNLTATATLKGNRTVKNGKTYLHYSDKNLKLKLGGGHVQFDDIFKGNEELTANTNRILNDNILVVFEELAPFLEDIIGSFIFNPIINVFSNYALEDLFKS